MPAKTPAKKAPAAKKPAAKRPAPKPAKAAPAPVAAAEPAQPTAALRAELEQLRSDALGREAELRRQVESLEKQLTDARKPDSAQAQQLRDVQAKLTTRQAELEAARAEAANLRDAVNQLRGPGEQGNLRCPRCGGHMTEYAHDPIKADRCDLCHGIFFDNGELEAVLLHHDEQRDAGKKSWFASVFGKK